MSRPSKDNADYFPHDNDMRNHRKIKSIRTKFGIIGYAIWNMILEYLTFSSKSRFIMNDMEMELLSGDFGVPVTEIRDVINHAVLLELLFFDGDFIYSKSLDENLSGVFSKRIRAKEDALNRTREHGKFASDKPQQPIVSDAEMPQTKLNYTKLNNTTLPSEEKTINASEVLNNIPPLPLRRHSMDDFADKLSNVRKLKAQPTFEEWDLIIKKHTEPLVKEVLEAMDNYKPLTKTSLSVYYTCNNWCRRRKGNGVKEQETSTSKRIPEL